MHHHSLLRGSYGDAPLNDIVMQAIITFAKEYAEKRKTIMSSVCGVQSIKLRAANGNTICIHEINGELVIKNE